MSNKINLVQHIAGHLKSEANKKYTARELAKWFLDTFPEPCQAKKEASAVINTDEELLQQLIAEVGANYKSLQKLGIKGTEGRPRRYYWSDKESSAEPAQNNNAVLAISANSSVKPNEHSLYPLLARFLWSEYSLYPKRIDEKRSSNTQGRGGNHWLHPDIVALQDIGENWKNEVKDCVTQYSAKRTRLWSFEVKIALNRSNVRESYFQSVSNSSWANFGYLVAEEINQDCIKELNMLAAAHGIGIILLNRDNAEESQVLIPAREHEEIDWDMVNRLADENKDFLDYVDLIKQFYQIGKARKQDWYIPTL